MRILIITLNNIGDVILTLPAIDILRRDFPQAQCTIVCGPKSEGLFKSDSRIKLAVFDKHASLKEKMNFTFNLRRERYDLLVDFRRTGFHWFLRSRKATSSFAKYPPGMHKREQHLARLSSVHQFKEPAEPRAIFVAPEDREYIELALARKPGEKLVVVSPGAANEWKRWTKKGFARVSDWLVKEAQVKLVLVGGPDDKPVVREIIGLMEGSALDLSGKTSLKQLACLLSQADLVVSCDSAIMHMASYYNIPTLAIFGPTDPDKYGPWSSKSVVVRSRVDCSPCEKSGCARIHECMEEVEPEQVILAIRENFPGFRPPEIIEQKKVQAAGKRILVVRTDRIGDVLLTSSVFRALRANYPDSVIAVMVAPAAREIVEGNPYIDEVIVYDKEGEDRGAIGFFRMVKFLRHRSFDVALVLHTKKRTNLLCFLAGIKERIGYHNNKFGFLLTKKIPDTRAQGKIHEAEYCLEVLRPLGIKTAEIGLFMPIKKSSEDWADELLKSHKIERKDKLIVINPGASCPSKVWPADRFAILADKLVEKYNARICLIAGPQDRTVVRQVLTGIRHPVIDLSGRTSLSQLASLLKRANLFISNDSGPMHIACAVGTPVVAIFGRNESGLSPKRWGPLSKNSVILHKEVGCVECLAHNCPKGFACLLAITEEEVLAAADKLLRNI